MPSMPLKMKSQGIKDIMTKEEQTVDFRDEEEGAGTTKSKEEESHEA